VVVSGRIATNFRLNQSSLAEAPKGEVKEDGFQRYSAAGILATAIPSLVGTLIAYSVIATILGAFLWAGELIPDDVGIAVAASGLVTGTLLIVGILIIRLARK